MRGNAAFLFEGRCFLRFPVSVASPRSFLWLPPFILKRERMTASVARMSVFLCRLAIRGMHRAMSSRPLCTSDGDPPPPNRCKHLHEPGIAKVRRTRKAPDFYSPEVRTLAACDVSGVVCDLFISAQNASKSCARPKKSVSDDNDSWKPESETDEVNSESDAERSDGRRETAIELCCEDRIC